MSYLLDPSRLYRAPTHFGPAPGPRQRPDGARWANVERPHVLTAWLTARIDAAQLDRHLPPDFAPADQPRLYIELRELRELDWLAGRGYNILHVSLGVRHRVSGQEGRLTACVFESRADPIITGRDELGIPKMFAEVSPLERAERRLEAEAAWDGFRFFDLRLDGLVEAAPSPEGPGGAPYMHRRYVPRVGAVGEADADYIVLGQADGAGGRVLASLCGGGSARFHRGRFEDLPTLVHIVDGLASLTMLETVGAGLVETRGRSDHRSTRSLASSEAPERPEHG